MCSLLGKAQQKRLQRFTNISRSVPALISTNFYFIKFNGITLNLKCYVIELFLCESYKVLEQDLNISNVQITCELNIFQLIGLSEIGILEMTKAIIQTLQ